MVNCDAGLKKCPHCGGTSFQVNCCALMDWDSKTGSWGSHELRDPTDPKEEAFYCYGCAEWMAYSALADITEEATGN